MLNDELIQDFRDDEMINHFHFFASSFISTYIF